MYQTPEQSNGEDSFSRRAFIGGVGLGAVGLGTTVLGGCTAASPLSTVATHVDAGSTMAAGDALTAQEEFVPTPQLAPYVDPSVRDFEQQRQSIKQVLVVVDYQVDFVDGVLGPIEPAIKLEDEICRVIKEYREAGHIIIYTMDTHPMENYKFTREGMVNPPHCVPGTEGWELYGKVADLLNPDNAILVMKGTYGSMDLPRVIEGIKSQGVVIESIEMAGVSTTCRVLHNAIILYNSFPEVDMVMDIRTTAGYSDENTFEMLSILEDWGFCVKW